MNVAGTTRRNRKSGNVDLVIETLRSDGPSSQAALSRRTELAPATINNIVQALRADGVVELRRVNGREALVELTAGRSAIVSIRVGASSVEAAWLDFAAETRFDAALPGSGGPEAVIALIRALGGEAARTPVSAIALGVEAPIDRATGAIAPWAAARLPGWREVDVREILERAFEVPVIADNDANFDALAEWTWGAGRGADCFLNVTCSEGIGSGLIIDGRVHRGGDGMAGQIGHMVVEQGGAVCFCGNRGCLATVVSERAIVQSLRGSDSERETLREIIAAAEAGDAACQRVLFESGRYLGRALANAAKIIAPKVVCVGGLLGNAKPFVLDGLNSSIEVTTHRAISPSIEFTTSELGPNARLTGGVAAALLAIGQGVSELAPWMIARTATRPPPLAAPEPAARA